MQCPICQTENTPLSKHCSECGAPLNGPCPACGFENPSKSKFCSDCGAKLGSQSALNPRSLSSAAGETSTAPKNDLTDGERKTITVLFADIQGSMELMETLDPEEARGLVDPALALMVDVVRRFDGHVVQSTGDGIFALFGAPIAHEDHAQRAIYAGLDLQERIERYSDSLREAGRLPIFVRVGVNTGEMVMRTVQTGDARVEYTPIGHATSLASRLQSLATAGAVVVGEQTRKLSDGFFQFRTMAPRPIKGVSHLVTAYEVLGPGPLRTRLEAAARRGLVRFVGRESELDQMKHALERARSGNGQIVAAVGDAGVGKSRLFHQFKATSRTGCLLLETAGTAHGRGWAYLPLIELLRSFFNLGADDDVEQRRQKIRQRLSSLDVTLLNDSPYLYALLGVAESDDPLAEMDRQLRKQRTLEAIRRILVRESLTQCVVIVFEDLHWFDSESLAFLDLLANSVTTLRILMLVNYRPEFTHSWGNRSCYSQLRMDPLESDSAEQLLSALLSDAAELRPLKSLIIEKSQGNPLFIEELVRTLFENGTLLRHGNQVEVSSSRSEIAIPATIEGIIAARIDCLPAAEKSILQALAIIGEEFPLPIARQVLGKPEDELQNNLGYLQRAEFIYEHPALSESEYSFKHALTHDVAYKSVLEERRKLIHGRTAVAIETLYPNRLEDHLSKLVDHYRRSGNVRKTFHYLHLAGQQAYERSAVADALIHFNAALEFVKQLPAGAESAEQELALQISLGNSLMSTGGFAAEGVVRAFGRARELCGRVGESSQLVPALFGLWAFHNFGGDLAAARELGEDLLTIADRKMDPGAKLMAHTSLGITKAYLGDLHSALEHCTQGVSVYNPAQGLPAFLAQTRTSCRTWLALVLALTGHPDRALRTSSDAVAAARESTQTVSMAYALIGAGTLSATLADPSAIKACSEELIALANKHGFVLALSWANIQHGYALALEGDSREGIAQILEGLATVNGARALTALTESDCWLAESYAIAGDPEAGLKTLDEASVVMEKSGERWHEAEVQRLKGELLRSHNPDAEGEAEKCFRSAIEIARHQGSKLWELRGANSIAALMLKQGRRAEALEILAPIYQSFPEVDISDLRQAKSILAQVGV